MQAAFKGKGNISQDGGQKKKKDRKTRKRKSEKKGIGFSSASPFPARKQESFTQSGTTGIDHPTWRRTQGAVIVKGWKDKQDRGRIPDTLT